MSSGNKANRPGCSARLAIVVSHPIQHFVPFYQSLAALPQIDLRVFYASNIGAEPYFDVQMGTEIDWKMDLLAGYQHTFLSEADRIKSTDPVCVNNPSIAGELDQFRPDIVLQYGYSQLTMLRALWWARKNKVPAIMTGDSQMKSHRSFLRRVLKQMIIPAVLRQFTCFLTVGDCNEDYYRQYGVASDKLFRSPFTIDELTYRTARTDRSTLRAELRSSLGIGDDEVVVLSVGKLAAHKRAMDVVRVARLLRDSPPTYQQVSFIMAGDGALMDDLRAEVAADELPVRLLGFVNLDQLPKVYAASDMILHPSSIDSHPLVMSEAACIGLPLIVSDMVGAIGPTDIARPLENSVVVPCGDVGALGDAVQLLANDEVLRAKMAARSIEIFDEQDIHCSVDGVLRAIDYCMQRAAEPSWTFK